MMLPFRRKTTAVAFVHPLDPAPKTIVLFPGFQNTRAIRVFPNGWTGEAARLGPCAVAGTLPDLRQLARAGVEVQHAVIVLTRSADSELSDHDRDLLWKAFGVPIFEQCLGPNNNLLAAECEAHDGMHVLSSGPGSALETSACGCGSRIPRRMPARQVLVLEPARMLA